jgi:hypothetical protein
MTDTKNPAATEHDRAVEAWRKAMQDHFDVESHDLERRLVDEAIELMRRPAADGITRRLAAVTEQFIRSVEEDIGMMRGGWDVADSKQLCEAVIRTAGMKVAQPCRQCGHDRNAHMAPDGGGCAGDFAEPTEKPAASPELLPGFYRAEFTDNEETFYFKVTDNGEWGRNVWGLSDYEGEWGYRTLGIPYQEWRDRHPGACVSADHDRGVEKRKPAASPTCVGAICIPDHVSPYTVWSDGELRQYDL